MKVSGNRTGTGELNPQQTLPELWGGIEATMNRVGDEYFNQMERSGHWNRIEDIEMIAETGIKAIRYPVLWELRCDERVDWKWADERLNALRQRGIKVIAGLTHHGGGPRHTSLLDPSFVTGLAAHARAVAERYPWIKYYTPVHEPLTTARFSALYGHWYPHEKNKLSFARALFTEIAATAAAMREIRRINPEAELVQTEDMGKTYSTKLLAYQAALENERRWMSLGLLCGRLNRECHLGCTREEQVRWILEVWNGAKRLRQEGADIRAVTIWSLLGAFDWNTLVTKQNGFYEPRAFDVRGARPRPTAIAKCMKALAETGEFRHPIACEEGWWRRKIRFTYKPSRPFATAESRQLGRWRWRPGKKHSSTLLITGATGTLGSAFKRLCDLRGLDYRLITRQEMDICDGECVQRIVKEVNLWAVINAAGYVRVDDAEKDQDGCYRANLRGPAELAKACALTGASMVTFSSDLVFRGDKRKPYVESDSPQPVNVYGRSKAECQRAALEILDRALVIRASAFFGPWDQHNFVTATLRKLRHEEPVVAAEDVFVSPTYIPDLVHATLDLLIDGETGIWRLANKGHTSWAQLAQVAASLGDAREKI